MQIAVLLATYNGETYIKELLDSLINQTFQDFVCYIHDDGSTDRTIEIVEEYSIQYPERFRILDYPPTGAAKANFMSLLKQISEPYAMFCDQDDVWNQEKIEISYKAIRKAEKRYPGQPILCFGDMKVVDSQLNTIDMSFFKYTGLDPNRTELRQLLVENVVAGCTTIMNQKLYSSASELKEYSHIQMHDLWIALVAAATGKIIYINRPLLLYRQHESNVKGAEKNKNIFFKALSVLKKVFSGEYIEKTRKWHSTFRYQAYELSKVHDVSKDICVFLREFCELDKKNKIERILFYKRHHIERKKHSLWMLLWC